jgi:hypothetical protein
LKSYPTVVTARPDGRAFFTAVINGGRSMTFVIERNKKKLITKISFVAARYWC